MAKQRKPRQSLEVSLAKIKGDIPVVEKDNYRVTLLRALNWYSANWEEKDYRKAADKYVRKLGLQEYTHCVSKATFNEIRSIGVMAHISTINYLDINHVEKMFVLLEDLKKKYAKVVVPVAAQVTKSAAPILSIQDRILDSARGHVGEIEGEIDQYLTSGETEFTGKGYLLTNTVSGAVAKKMAELLQPRLDEFNEAMTSKDPQIKEAYSYIRKPFLKKMVTFIEQIIADCAQQIVSARAQRKPRARKVKPPSVLVKKLRYLKEFTELNLKSIEPAKIIGSAELWVYNTGKRKMTVFYGADGGYLGVSGTSVTNYDVSKSETKTLRKPEEFFKGLTSTGKRALANAWKAVKSKATSPRGRISEEMILFAVN